MSEKFVGAIESYLRLNATGEMSDRMALDYIKLELRRYKKIKNGELLKTKDGYVEVDD